MNKKIVWLLIVVLMLFAGCATHQEENKQYNINRSELFYFPEENGSLHIIGMGKDGFYYFRRTDWEENGFARWTTQFFKQNYSAEVDPMSIPLYFENTFHIAFFVTNNKDTNDVLHLLIMDEADQEKRYKILVYTEKGDLLKEIMVTDKRLSEETVINILPLNEDYYGILSLRKLFIIDGTGGVQNVFECSDGIFQGITSVTEKELAVSSYSEKNGTANLSIVNWTNNQLLKKLQIKGDGKVLSCDGENIYSIVGETIYKMNLNKKETKTIISLSGRNVSPSKVIEMKSNNEDIALLAYGTYVNGAKYICFSSDKEDRQAKFSEQNLNGKKQIEIYVNSEGIWKVTELGRIIDAFNEQSNSYQVMLKDYSLQMDNKEFDFMKMIVEDNYPDLFFSSQNKLMDELLKKDCFEDLMPYFEHSEKISVSDIALPVLNAYLLDGKMYSIPKDFQISSIMGKKSQLGEPGWTVDEFLKMLEETSNIDSRMNLTRNNVYEMCIDSVLDSCLDTDSEHADFMGEQFKSFAIRIKNLNLSNEIRKPDYSKPIDPDSLIIEEVGIERLSRAALAELKYGEECVFKGYPGNDGTPVYYFSAETLSIFKNSEVKEGAFEFLEFYLTYQGTDIYANSSVLFSLNSYLEKGIKQTLQSEINMQDELTIVTKHEQIDKILELFPYAVPQKEKYKEIKIIIDEELQPYFENQKDIDSTCSNIQNRVELYLRE